MKSPLGSGRRGQNWWRYEKYEGLSWVWAERVGMLGYGGQEDVDDQSKEW